MNKQEIELNIELLKGNVDGFKKLLIEQPDHPMRGSIEHQIDALEMAISALTQQLNNGWIPVSEPPSEYGTYMVAWRPINMTEGDVKTRTRSKITHFYEILEYDPEDESGWIETIKQSEGAYEILAWQPLPEPYKEASE